MTNPEEQLFVYVIQSESGHQKIGRSNNPDNRLRYLQNGNPFRLNLVHKILLEQPVAYLTEMHALWVLKSKRVNGEWFACSVDEAVKAVSVALDAVSSGSSKSIRGIKVAKGVQSPSREELMENGDGEFDFSNFLDTDEVIAALRREVAEAGSQTAWAAAKAVSLPYVNDVLHGRRDPGDAILSALGLRRVVLHERIAPAA